jgi:hypothetical protein
MSFFWKQAANIKMHRWNYNLPIEETLKAMYYVVNAGRVRYLGASTIQRIVPILIKLQKRNMMRLQR